MLRSALAYAVLVGATIVAAVACDLQLSGSAAADADASLGDASTLQDGQTSDAVADGAPDAADCDADAACGSFVVELTGDGYHFCARTQAGEIYCWGRNTEGQLGAGDVAPHPRPVRVVRTSDGGTIPPFVQVSAGYLHTCARAADDAVHCWGANQFGQAGQPMTIPVTSQPSRVGALSASDISSGGTHTCAVDHAQDVWCWGYNANFQLGYPAGARVDAGEVGCASGTCNPQPTRATGVSGATRVSLAYVSSCAVVANGGVSCWGDDSSGELADPSLSSAVATPEIVTLGDAGPLRGVTEVAASWLSVCSVATDGVARCWGSNTYGNLVSPPSGAIFVPQSFGTSNMSTAIAVGTAHTCVVASGRVSCAGWNGEGELGRGTIGGDAGCPAFAPTQSPNQCVVGFVDVGVTNVLQVAANITATCALTKTGRVFCWGENSVAQLGHPFDTLGDVPCNGSVGSGGSRCNALPIEVKFP